MPKILARKSPKIYTADDVLNAAKAAGRIPNNLRLLNKFLDIWWDLFPTHYEKAHVKNKASKLGMITGFVSEAKVMTKGSRRPIFQRDPKVTAILDEVNSKALIAHSKRLEKMI